MVGKATRTQTLVNHLRQQIIDAEISAGEKLPSENELVAEHGVSRTVVREALLRLQTAGFIHTRRGAGSYALVPPAESESRGHFPVARTLEDRLHLLTYRSAIEAEAAALCAQRGVSAAGVELSRLADALEAKGSTPSAAMARDYEFHAAIARESGNPYIRDAVEALGPAMIVMPHERLDNSAAKGPDYEKAMERVASEHRAIVAAIVDGEPIAAAAAMRVHLQNSRRRLEGREATI